MRKIFYTMLIIILLFICSMILVSCEAITAQNINNTGSDPQINIGPNGTSRMNGGPGGPGRNGAAGMNDYPRINESQPK